ncbi:MAG: UvrD-helicase domain-containing protein [Prevotellaceae bacterium]|jgi:superfamily I DNA/RNA helicase|nr:UvrD-helicase domain-containing protein [Prevotellaceae bacterium]
MTSNINISSLNKEQQEAVVSKEKRLLVLAGAGSGKTMTLLQKIVYLIEQERVKSANILAVTFTKNAANEMLDRLIMSVDSSGNYYQKLSNKNTTNKEKGFLRVEEQKTHQWIKALTIRTFHSLCYKILREYGAKEFDNKFRIIGDSPVNEDDEFSEYKAKETVFEVFHKLLIQLCDNTGFLIQLKRYILDYYVDKIHHTSNYSNSYEKLYTTLDGTKVRSKSEQFIADWFFRNNIQYRYEAKRQVTEKGFTFCPDFYLPEANLYIEHISDKSYPINDKLKEYGKAGLKVEFTYEKDTHDSALLSHILDSIIKNRLSVDYTPKTLNYEETFNGFLNHIAEFIKMTNRVADMTKVENVDIDKIAEQASKDQHERVRNFYQVAIPLIKKYNEYCVDKSYLDFNDLLIRCNSLMRNQPDIANKLRDRFKYILVDEFQDVNSLQVNFIKMLLTENTQLFCVGDDWQSIYGFRGSDVSYIVEFEKNFPNSNVIKLNLNYRSTENIVEAGNEIIKHNKFKIDKEIKAIKPSAQKIVLYSANQNTMQNPETINYCIENVKKLQENGFTSDDILFLYRRNHMFRPTKYSDNPSFAEAFKNEGIKVQAKTIHAAKGLEAKVVFIIGLTEGSGGFPDIWLEDRIFQVIKPANHDLLMEEERRLFYVAVTRAKDILFLISQKGNESSFIDEIPENLIERVFEPIQLNIPKILICDRCKKQVNENHKFCPTCGTQIKR